MLDGLKDKLKQKLTLTDSQLEKATKYAKWAKWYSKSGVWFWGGMAVVGAGALGLGAVGVPIPAFIGVSTVTTGVLMTAKSVVLEQTFAALERKGEKTAKERGIGGAPAAETSEAPEAPRPSVIAGLKRAADSFNAKAEATVDRIRDAVPALRKKPKPFTL